MNRFPTSSRCRKASTWAKPWVWPRTEARPYNFGRPTDIGWDAQGNIFVTDGYTNSRVVKYNPEGRYLAEVGTRGSEIGQLSTHAIDCRNPDELLVAEITTWRVQKLLLDPRLTSQ